MSAKPTRQDALLAALQRQPVNPAPPPAAAIEKPAVTPPETTASTARPKAPARAGKVGKPIQFWMHEEDRKLIRELSAWLAGQGIRPSDSMVVRAALRMAKPGAALLDSYRQSAALDGRLKRPSTAPPGTATSL
jgi:hypothetical protein